MVVRRIMNGTGVLKVYLIQSKRYAYRLRFVRAMAPEWVLEALKDINKEDAIGFEAEVEEEEDNQIQDMIEKIEGQQEDSINREMVEINDDDEDEVQFIGDHLRETLITQSIESIEDAWDENLVKKEKEDESNLRECSRRRTRATERLLSDSLRSHITTSTTLH